MEFDDGEMIVVRHEYDAEWTDASGQKHLDRQNDAFYAVRDPESYDLSDGNVHRWTSGAFKIPDAYIGDVHDVAGYRKLLDAVEARLIARKEASNDAV